MCFHITENGVRDVNGGIAQNGNHKSTASVSARLFCPAQFITAPIALSKYSESSSYCFATKIAFSLIGVERLTLAIALSTDTSENSVVSAGVSVTSGVGVGVSLGGAG